MNDNLTYNKDGLALTESFEGYRSTAYQDIRGRWTIGYGHCGPDVYPGRTVTQSEAEALLVGDVAWAEVVVRSHVKIPLNQEEFNALVDFVYNCGGGNFESSTLLKDINLNDLEGAAKQFERWDKADGTVVAGLLRRRLAEEALFERSS